MDGLFDTIDKALGPSKVQGNFAGDPKQISADIAAIADPATRKQAQAAFAQQYKTQPESFDGSSGFSASAIDNAFKTADMNPVTSQAAAKQAKQEAKPAAIGVSPPEGFAGIAEGAANVLSGAAQQAESGYRGIYAVMKHLKDGGSFNDAMAKGAEAINSGDTTVKAYQPRTEAGKQVVAGLGSDYNPLVYVQKKAEQAGDKAGDYATSLGFPAEVGGGIKAAFATAPMLIPLRLKGAGVVKEVAPAVKAAEDVAVKPPINYDVPTYIRNKAETVAPEVNPGVQVNANETPVYKRPGITPNVSTEKPVIPEQSAEKPIVFEDVKQSSNVPVNDAQYAENKALAQRLGITRTTEDTLRQDMGQRKAQFEQARLIDTPKGKHYADVLAGEHEALVNAAENIVKDAGGTLGNAELTRVHIGNSVAAPIDALKEWQRKATNALYAEGDKATQGKPVVQPTNIEALLNDTEFKNAAMGDDLVHLKDSVANMLESFKANNPEGLTVKNMEQLRKFVNARYTHTNTKVPPMIHDIVTAIDNDTFAAAGADVYKAGRDMHALSKRMLVDPKAINKIFTIDPKGNRATRIEKVPQAILSLPVDEFGQLISVYKNLPPELAPMGTKALAEIKGRIGNEIADAVKANSKMTNPKAVRETMESLSGKMKVLQDEGVLTPQEVARYQDLQKGVNLFHIDPSYPGAAAQASFLTDHAAAVGGGSMAGLGSAVGAGATSLTGVPGLAWLGGTGGGAAGAFVAKRAVDRAALGRAQARTINLRDMVPKK